MLFRIFFSAFSANLSSLYLCFSVGVLSDLQFIIVLISGWCIFIFLESCIDVQEMHIQFNCWYSYVVLHSMSISWRIPYHLEFSPLGCNVSRRIIQDSSSLSLYSCHTLCQWHILCSNLVCDCSSCNVLTHGYNCRLSCLLHVLYISYSVCVLFLLCTRYCKLNVLPHRLCHVIGR